jgi:tyrosyl-tRNA synthetase
VKREARETAQFGDRSVSPSMRAAVSALVAGCKDVVSEIDLQAKLARAEAEGRPLRVKLGIDASGPDIHLGFAVVLQKLRQFQDHGHTAVLIVGDFTGMIGDPSGRSKTRPQLSHDQIERNMARYKDQVFRILRSDRAELVYNSAWSDPLTARQIVDMAAKLTVARIIEREDFRSRLNQGLPLGLHEVLYPLFQGYDSVAVRSDIELGGADQYWNLLVGRDLQRECGQEPQVIMTMPLLEGTDGRLKMSKSYNNYIAIEEQPDEMYGKVMSLPDGLLERFFELAAGWGPDEVKRVATGLAHGDNPRDWKDRLGREIVARYHGATAAKAAAAAFDRVFRAHQPPEQMPEFAVRQGQALVDVIVAAGLLSSKSEVRRKVAEGAIYLDGVRVSDTRMALDLTAATVLKVGKRRFCRLVPGPGA